MTNKFSTVSTLVLASFLASGAIAADLGSTKDDPIFGSAKVSSTKSGFYISGSLGVAEIDRSVSRSVERNINLDVNTTGATAEEIADAQDELAEFGIPSAVNGNTLSIPLIGDRLGLKDSDELSATVFGGELSYLYHPGGRFGFSLGLGGTVYNDAESSHAYAGQAGKFVGGTAASDFSVPTSPTTNFTCADVATCAGDPSPFPQSGFVTVDRDYDIDLIARVHFFATDRLALNIGAGASLARAKVSGGNFSGGTGVVADAFDTSYSKDDTTVGLVLAAGVDYYLTDRITVGLDYNYKRHTFEIDSSSGATLPLGTEAALSGGSKVSDEIEDESHTIKAKIGFKLN